MAAPGQPMFYRMTKVVNEYLNGTTHVHYEARDSELGDFNFDKEFGDPCAACSARRRHP